MSHHPDTERVLAVGMGTSTIRWALDALTAAGMSVVDDQGAPLMTEDTTVIDPIVSFTYDGQQFDENDRPVTRVKRYVVGPASEENQ